VLESGEVALDGAGVYDGVFSAPGAVAPWALGDVEPVRPPSGPLVAPDDVPEPVLVPVVDVWGFDVVGVPSVVLPVVVGIPLPAGVSVAVVSSASSGASMPPLDCSTTVESDAGSTSGATTAGTGAAFSTSRSTGLGARCCSVALRIEVARGTGTDAKCGATTGCTGT
jgi:hypothetical protein